MNAELDRLLKIKRSTTEGDTVARSPVFDAYLERTFAEVEANIPPNGKHLMKKSFNDAFRETLKRIAAPRARRRA
jgi:hypothetical protein